MKEPCCKPRPRKEGSNPSLFLAAPALPQPSHDAVMGVAGGLDTLAPTLPAGKRPLLSNPGPPLIHPCELILVAGSRGRN